MSVLREGSGTRWLTLAAGAIVISVVTFEIGPAAEERTPGPWLGLSAYSPFLNRPGMAIN